MKIVAVIPVKEVSERVPKKNFKNFSKDKSLLDILIGKLKKCPDISKIYISSNSKLVSQIAKKNNCKYIERKKKFCNNVTPWSEVIYEVSSSIPEDDNTILMWCHTTSPIFNRYNEAIKIFKRKKTKYDGLIAVEKFKKFIVSEKRTPVNYSWGVWHPYSQNLEDLYAVTGTLFMMSIRQFKKNRYVISKNPYYLETNHLEGLDIDTPNDFKFAQFIYNNKKKLKIL